MLAYIIVASAMTKAYSLLAAEEWLQPFFIVSPAAGCCVCQLSLCFAIFSLLPSSLLFLFFSSFLFSTIYLYSLEFFVCCYILCLVCLILYQPSRSVLCLWHLFFWSPYILYNFIFFFSPRPFKENPSINFHLLLGNPCKINILQLLPIK